MGRSERPPLWDSIDRTALSPPSPVLSGYDPAIGGNLLIEVQSLFGVEDSTVFTNYRRDDFFCRFYNLGDALLAALRISNPETDYGFWRRDGDLQAGGTETGTGEEFVRGELHNLNALIDLANNTWTVLIDEIPIFEKVPFNGTTQPCTLGPVAIKWQVAAGNRFAYGDNWMLVVGLSIETIEEFPPPLSIDSIVRNPPGSITHQLGCHSRVQLPDGMFTRPTKLIRRSSQLQQDRASRVEDLPADQ
jgi:hypothetical protein